MSFEKNISDELIEHLIEKYSNAVINDKKRFEFYESVDDEYKAFRKGVAIRNISSNATIELKGEETLNFLNRITSNNIKDLPLNFTIKTLFTNIKGGILGRTSVLHLKDRVLLLGNFQNNQRLSLWIRNFITKENISIEDLTDKNLVLELYGPQTESYLTILCGNEIDNLELNQIKTFDSDGFKFDIIKNPDAAGNVKYWLLYNDEKVIDFVNYLLDSKSVFDVRMAGDTAFEIFRIEEGIPIIPSELNNVFMPHEANLMCEVDEKKDAFIGSDKIFRKKTVSISHKLKGFILEDNFIFDEPIELFNEINQYVGILTVSCESKLMKKNIALGYIDEDLANKESLSLYNRDNKKINLLLTNLPFRK